jgi:hypothetical protein
MNPGFWNIFPVSSRGFSGRISVGIVPSSVRYKILKSQIITFITLLNINLRENKIK